MEHDCQKTATLLADYLGGKLTQGDRQRLDLIFDITQSCYDYIGDVIGLLREDGLNAGE